MDWHDFFELLHSLRIHRVSHCGAPAGSLLCGVARHNRGLRIRVLQEQEPGYEGMIQGRFVLLAAGDNPRAPALAPLLRRETDAAEVLAVLRRTSPQCVNIVHTRILGLDRRAARHSVEIERRAAQSQAARSFGSQTTSSTLPE